MTERKSDNPAKRIISLSLASLVVAFILNPLLAIVPFILAGILVAILWYPTETHAAVSDIVQKITVEIPAIDWGAFIYHGTAIVALTVGAIAITAGVTFFLMGDEMRDYLWNGVDTSDE